MKKISASEAYAIFHDVDSKDFPFRVLNKYGESIVEGWVAKKAKGEHVIGAWFVAAENEANSDSDIDDLSIKMSGFATLSGHVETLTLEASCFDWMIVGGIPD